MIPSAVDRASTSSTGGGLKSQKKNQALTRGSVNDKDWFFMQNLCVQGGNALGARPKYVQKYAQICAILKKIGNMRKMCANMLFPPFPPGAWQKMCLHQGRYEQGERP